MYYLDEDLSMVPEKKVLAPYIKAFFIFLFFILFSAGFQTYLFYVQDSKDKKTKLYIKELTSCIVKLSKSSNNNDSLMKEYITNTPLRIHFKHWYKTQK